MKSSGAKGINPDDENFIDYFLPIVADAEAGFGGVLNAFELMKSMINAGAAGVHWEDQLASVKKCGHMGGKVLVPTSEAIQKLTAARLAADVLACLRWCWRAPMPMRQIC
jgi:isocitrate lyase